MIGIPKDCIGSICPAINGKGVRYVPGFCTFPTKAFTSSSVHYFIAFVNHRVVVNHTVAHKWLMTVEVFIFQFLDEKME